MRTEMAIRKLPGQWLDAQGSVPSSATGMSVLPTIQVARRGCT